MDRLRDHAHLDEQGLLTTAVLCAALAWFAAPAAAQEPPGCDPLDPAACLYPWPNDHFTVADPSTATGRRLALRDELMPRNRLGKPVSAAPYNHNDGFSPGNMIVTRVPGLDTPEAFRSTGAVPITDIERSFDPAQPVVVINARTLECQLIWSELDANPADPRDVTLIVRPARNLEEGERYIVALRNLRDAGGQALEPQPAFRALRDGLPHPGVEGRRAHFEARWARPGSSAANSSGTLACRPRRPPTRRRARARTRTERRETARPRGARSRSSCARAAGWWTSAPGCPACPDGA